MPEDTVDEWVYNYVIENHSSDLYPLNEDFLVGAITDAINAYLKAIQPPETKP